MSPLPFVRTVVHEPELGSTNDEARRRLQAGGVALPLLVRADRQTAGRGRGANRWWSDAGSLTFTLAIDPAAHGLREEHTPRVALAAAVAVVEALEDLVPPGRVGIRWPNDVEARGRKLGGILPERVATPTGPRLAIGIGLNVTTELEGSPPEIRRMATSVAELARPGEAVTLDGVLTAVLARFARILAALAANDPALAARWSGLDALRGQSVRIRLGEQLLTGVAQGIDARGGLCLETPDGATTLFGGQVLRDE
jgi:BirA family biotin operon repressor/biotin-[acetyl-CoA-carboxylase] ligase